MDLYAHDNLDDYHTILADYLGSTAWYLGPNGLPMISTFSDGGLNIKTWTGNLTFSFESNALILTYVLAWRQEFASKMYFIPDFDHTTGYYQVAPEVSLASDLCCLALIKAPTVVVVLLGQIDGRCFQLGSCMAFEGRLRW